MLFKTASAGIVVEAKGLPKQFPSVEDHHLIRPHRRPVGEWAKKPATAKDSPAVRVEIRMHRPVCRDVEQAHGLLSRTSTDESRRSNGNRKLRSSQLAARTLR